MSRRPFAFAAGFLLLALVAGCASGPRILVNQDPQSDLAGFRSYGYVAPLDTDQARYSSLLSLFLRNATDRELQARGYVYSANQPDLLVNFHVSTTEKIQSNTVPAAPYYGGYYGYRYPYYGVWNGYETYITQYTEGTLNIDVVDAARKQLVWEGTAIGRVRASDQERLEAQVNTVVAQVLARFPAARR